MRRYEISQVYMQNKDTPKWLAAIDIVRAGADCAVGRDAPMLAEAELIRMVCDVCSSVEALKGCSIDIQLSHASLLVGVLDHVGVDATVQDSFLHALQTLMATRLPGEKGHAAGLKSKAWATFCQQLQQLNLPVGRAKPLLLSVPTDPSDAVKWCVIHGTQPPGACASVTATAQHVLLLVSLYSNPNKVSLYVLCCVVGAYEHYFATQQPQDTDEGKCRVDYTMSGMQATLCAAPSSRQHFTYCTSAYRCGQADRHAVCLRGWPERVVYRFCEPFPSHPLEGVSGRYLPDQRVDGQSWRGRSRRGVCLYGGMLQQLSG